MKNYSAYRKMHARAAIAIFAVVLTVPTIAHAGIMLSTAPGPTVTFILSLDDNGAGRYTRGSFAVYAVDSTADGNQGIEAFALDIAAVSTFASINTRVAAYGNYDDGTAQATDVEIGFNALRKATTASTANTYNLVASQDNIDANGTAVFVYGFGQTSGNLSQWAPAGSTGLDTSIAHTTNQNYGVNVASATGVSSATSALLLDTGTYNTADPVELVTNAPATELAQVWTDQNNAAVQINAASGGDIETASVVLDTVALPEPTGTIVLALGSGVLLLRRRSLGRSLRRINQI